MISIHAEGISKIYPGGAGQPQVLALDRISANVEEGEFVCLIGPSGCGKTTLLHMIAGFTFPSLGLLLYKDRPITGPGPDRTVIFQEYGLFPWLTVSENIEFGLLAAGVDRAARQEIVRDYISLVHLEGFEHRYPTQLSGGMKQRVGIARALAPDPDMVLMDEPFGALDALTRDFMQEEILSIWEKKRKTVILITHSIDEAIFLGDRVIVMTARPGRIKEVVKIDMPRPRDPEIRATGKQFLHYKEHLSHTLRTELGNLNGR